VFRLGEGVFFDSLDAVEAEAVEDDGAGEVELGGSDGFEALDVGAAEFDLGLVVFFGGDGGMAGETVFEAVHAGTVLAFGGFGAGGFFGVGPVGGELFVGYRHGEMSPRLKSCMLRWRFMGASLQGIEKAWAMGAKKCEWE
jgi:hypothetical protein